MLLRCAILVGMVLTSVKCGPRTVKMIRLTSDVLQGTDSAGIWAWIDNDCTQHPLNQLVRVTEVREYLVEAKNADEAAASAENGEAFMHEYAHCHTLDWDVCGVKPVPRPRANRR